MAKNIEPNLRKIGEYLNIGNNDATFVIPEYQRAYSWGIDRCDKLWSDIVDYVNSDKKDAYFFGTIILNCQNNDEDLLLIDGQQRTTSFYLLLKAFLLRIENSLKNIVIDDDSKKIYNALSLRRKEIISILYKIDKDDVPDDLDEPLDLDDNAKLFCNKSIREQYESDFETIMNAASFEDAEYNVTQIKYKKGDNRFTNFFRNFKFFYNKINELQDPMLNTVSKGFIEKCEIIEIKSWNLEQAITMFNSLNSDSLPLNDADIISSLLYEQAEKRGVQKDFKNLWEDLHSICSKLEQTDIANIDSILMQYMYYNRTKNHDTISETGSVDVTTPGLRRYFTEINKDILTDPIKFSNDMINIAKLWGVAYEYPSVQVLLKYNENAKLFLASYFCRFRDVLNEYDTRTIVECLLRLFVIMEMDDFGYSSKYFKMFLFGEEVKMIDDNISVNEIKSDFEKHIKQYWTEENIRQKIFDCDKHVLVYLNEYLYAREKNLDFDLKSKYDIEHIMPGSGKNIAQIRSDAKLSDEDEFKNTINKLGNKILLESSINRAIGNEWFRSKISNTIEDRQGYVNSKYPLANALVEKYKDSSEKFWTKDNIIDATNKAADRIVRFIYS